MHWQVFRNHPYFAKKMKTLEPGDYLFRQGEAGNTMFIIMEGSLQLIGERDGVEHVAALLNAGEFLGEKGILKEAQHTRLFSVKAAEEVTVLELGLKEIQVLESQAPEFAAELFKRSFQIAAERLDRANYLARILRSSDNHERVLQLIRYFCRTAGKKETKGTLVYLTPAALQYHIDMEFNEIEGILSELCLRGLLLRADRDSYFVPDEAALLSFLPHLKKSLLKQAA